MKQSAIRRSLVITLCILGTSLLPGTDARAERRFDHAQRVAEVFAAERAFARSMAERDFAAFQRYVAEDTVFFDGERPLVGRAAVLEVWRRYFEPGPAPFAWEPDQVVVLQSGDLAHSSGPVTAPGGKVAARFNSVWRRQRDGRWQVVFDRGCAVCASPRT